MPTPCATLAAVGLLTELDTFLAEHHQGFQVSLGEHGAGQWIAVFFHGRGMHESSPSPQGHGAGADALAGGAEGGVGGGEGPAPSLAKTWTSLPPGPSTVSAGASST
jgi:hypothetical protein